MGETRSKEVRSENSSQITTEERQEMTKRRGSVFQRQGSWGYALSYTSNSTRQQLKRQGFATRKEAEQALTKALGDIDGGRLHGAGSQTVEGFLNSWFVTWSGSNRVKLTTVAATEIDIRCYLIPQLGSLKLKKLQPKHIQDMLNNLLTEGRIKENSTGSRALSAKTVRNIFSTLRHALSDAVSWELLPNNPADKVKPPVAQHKEPKAWSEEQVAQFLWHVTAKQDPYAAVWRLLLVTGMRRGELLGLRWSDIDLVEALVTVRQARVVAAGKVITTTPKSRAGNRSFTIDSETVVQLAQLKNEHELQAQRFGYWATELVAVSPTGLPMQPKDLLQRFQRAARAAGLPVLKLHEGRHTAATWALQEGIPVHVVSQRLGHSQASTTVNTYAHVLPTADKQAAHKLGSKLEQLLATAAEGSKKVAASSELHDKNRTAQHESLTNQDTTNTDKLEKSAPPRIRKQRKRQNP